MKRANNALAWAVALAIVATVSGCESDGQYQYNEAPQKTWGQALQEAIDGFTQGVTLGQQLNYILGR